MAGPVSSADAMCPYSLAYGGRVLCQAHPIEVLTDERIVDRGCRRDFLADGAYMACEEIEGTEKCIAHRASLQTVAGA